MKTPCTTPLRSSRKIWRLSLQPCTLLIFLLAGTSCIEFPTEIEFNLGKPPPPEASGSASQNNRTAETALENSANRNESASGELKIADAEPATSGVDKNAVVKSYSHCWHRWQVLHDSLAHTLANERIPKSSLQLAFTRVTRAVELLEGCVSAGQDSKRSESDGYWKLFDDLESHSPALLQSKLKELAASILEKYPPPYQETQQSK